MNTTFFEAFLVFTQVQTGIFIALLIGLFILLKYLEKKEIINLSARLMLATFLGLGLGLAILLVAGMPETPLAVTWINEVRTWYGLVADGFMALLRMLVVPLVLVSIIRVIVNMEGGKSVGKLVSRGVGMLIATTLIGATIGIFFAQIFGLGTGAELVYGSEEVREMTSIVSTIFNLIPDNPFAALSAGAIIPVIIFATFVGFAIRMQRGKDVKVVQPFIDFNEAVYAIIMNMAQTVIGWLPYAIIALLANTIASRGLQVFVEVAAFAGVFVLSVLVMFSVHLVILTLNGLNPVKYVQNIGKALILAFTSRSSLGTLPASIETLTQNAGLNQGTATFVMSLGANGGMNGSAGIYSAMISIMIANMVGHPVDVTFIVMLLLVVALSSFGIAGVPGGIMLTISIPLTALGLGEYFALTAAVFAIDPILDMFRTFVNVSGALTTSLVVGKSLDEVDTTVFNAAVVEGPVKA
ncbi:MAG: cation:dicarboxylase symporter family transporter [Turicibacter sp.]|nr:cation:dicarboxylase symporter family transporter [Turicibacter sp.]